MRWGSQLEFFEQVATDTGEILPPIERMPEVYPDLQDYVTAFHDLSAGRPAGFSGAEPLPLTEILAYRDAFMPDEEPQRFLLLIRGMDRAYLEAVAAEQKRKQQNYPGKTR